MRTRLFGLVLITASVAVAAAQSKLASDINPESLSRLPPPQRDSLDAEGKRVWDLIAGGRAMGKTGPAPVSMYSPGAAEPIHHLNQYLRKTVAGPRYFELSALLAAREFDQRYRMVGTRARSAARWSRAVGHRCREVQQGRCRPAGQGRNGHPSRARAVPRAQGELGAVGEDGGALRTAGAVEIVTTMGDYVMAGFLLTAVDQQLPPERKPLLPVK